MARRQQPPPSTKPFPEALADLATHLGIPTHKTTGEINRRELWAAIGGHKAIGDVMTIYRLMNGERSPTAEYMRIIARGLNVDPAYFAEWRLLEARDAFDPTVVGWDAAIAAWQAWDGFGAIPKAPIDDNEAPRRSGAKKQR